MSNADTIVLGKITGVFANRFVNLATDLLDGLSKLSNMIEQKRERQSINSQAAHVARAALDLETEVNMLYGQVPAKVKAAEELGAKLMTLSIDLHGDLEPEAAQPVIDEAINTVWKISC